MAWSQHSLQPGSSLHGKAGKVTWGSCCPQAPKSNALVKGAKNQATAARAQTHGWVSISRLLTWKGASLCSPTYRNNSKQFPIPHVTIHGHLQHNCTIKRWGLSMKVMTYFWVKELCFLLDHSWKIKSFPFLRSQTGHEHSPLRRLLKDLYCKCPF